MHTGLSLPLSFIPVFWVVAAVLPVAWSYLVEAVIPKPYFYRAGKLPFVLFIGSVLVLHAVLLGSGVGVMDLPGDTKYLYLSIGILCFAVCLIIDWPAILWSADERPG